MSTTLKKQPNETRIYGMSFSNKLRSSTETLTSINSIDIYPDDASLTAIEYSVGTNIANIQVSGGDNGRTYKITVLVTTSDNQILENEGLMEILDI